MIPLSEPQPVPQSDRHAAWRGSPKAGVSRDEGPGVVGGARTRGACNGPNLGTPRVRALAVLWGFLESFPEKKSLMKNVSAFEMLT